MPKHSRLRSPLLAALACGGLAVGVVGCGDRKSEGDALNQDSSLSRDLALAGQSDSAQPKLQDVPTDSAPAPAPVATTPAPAPPRTTTRNTSTGTTTRTPPRTTTRPAPTPTPSAPTAPTRTASGNTVTPNAGGAGTSERSGVGTIPAGTTLLLTSNSKVCTNTNRVGERFSATVANAVTGANGATIPAGATATVEITQLDRSENARDKIQMGFKVVSVTFGGRTYAVAATTESADVSRVRNEPASKDRQKVIGGAVVGAIAGQILGKDTKGTIIGAAAGAGAAAATANYEGCLNDGASLNIRLTEATQVRIS